MYLYGTFSICFDVISRSLELALTMSLYVRSDLSFFSIPPDSLIQMCGRREWGIPCFTIPRNFSDLGSLGST